MTESGSLEAEKKIARVRLKLMAARSDREIRTIRNEIFLAEQSRSITPEISILKSNVHRAITLKELQSSLSSSEAVLEYVVDGPASYCVVVSRENSRIVKLPAKQIISPLVSAYLSEGKAKHSAHDEARHLYDVLLDPIPEAKSKEQIIIVRDGQLHLVPYDALLNRNMTTSLNHRLSLTRRRRAAFSCFAVFSTTEALRSDGSGRWRRSIPPQQFDTICRNSWLQRISTVKSPKLTRRSPCGSGRFPERVEDVAAWRRRD